GRLSPQGRRKTLLIENADRMQEGARNCLLKILEEPPDSLNIVLCAQRRDAIMPTLLSRLRPYRFLKRGQAEEGEVIRRIFKEPSEAAASLGLASYIDSFLSQPGEKIRALAAFWIASVARFTLLSLKKSGKAPEELVSLGLYCSPLAEAAGLGKPASASEACSKVLLESGNFEDRSFSRFLRYCLELVSQALQKTGLNPQAIPYIDIWRKNAAEADAAMGTWNQNAPMALEAFFFRLKREMGGICEMNK
ncbi:MAG: DNA polymerase III, partial [Treponema sp.]|nr:DNA polymerase III [Treponema sp.]